ncbi:MAG: anhydro-N-acetylmuramic acid kinase [Lentimicrobiaceae bacterium]|nr:anhydro-N-acetylmuramic acid kinase [Lentimicrobiaceae bacterium]
MEEFKVIGIMSGSSLDGIDIAYCKFYFIEEWKFEIIYTTTHYYDEEWRLLLANATSIGSEELIKLDIDFGNYIGKVVSNFINDKNIEPNIISSHGHTVFHAPENGYTLQLGNGQAIANKTGVRTIFDFRTEDILNGGQGAPLVPIGDQLLFNSYDYCLNVGGIANISFTKDDKRVGFDVCPANQLLNFLSQQLGKPYDEDGNFAQLGKINPLLFDQLNNHPYYNMEYPKSISNQLVQSSFIPMLDNFKASIEDKLYTVCKHIAFQTNKYVVDKKSKILITGGGANNKFLVRSLQLETNAKVIVPNSNIIDFKEAIIFGLMGVLKQLKLVNCLSSVTGANKDSSTGIIANP